MARITSGEVTITVEEPFMPTEAITLPSHNTQQQECNYQPAIVWNGITAYCYDCLKIDGCGYCGGNWESCVPGNEIGPTSGSCGSDEWQYDKCASGNDNKNPYGTVSV